MDKIVLIVGPTGVGKTEIGVHLAQRFNGEIINADSRQMYAELKVGTSLPPEEFFQKVPHHLFGVALPTDRWNAARFQREADRIIHDIIQKKEPPFIVGGTGLYIRSLLFGLFEGPSAKQAVRQGLEEEIAEKGLSRLYGELKKVDPKAASKIHPNDPHRIIRALEVYRITGKPISLHQELHRFEKPRYDYKKIGVQVERGLLRKKIDSRVNEMMERGLEEEVRNLVNKWGTENFLLAHAIGYKEWFPYFDGRQRREEIIERIKINTRQFAKNQMTWFRKEKDIVWFDADDLSGMEEEVQKFFG